MQSTISTLENDPPMCKADTDCEISKIFFLYFLLQDCLMIKNEISLSTCYVHVSFHIFINFFSNHKIMLFWFNIKSKLNFFFYSIHY